MNVKAATIGLVVLAALSTPVSSATASDTMPLHKRFAVEKVPTTIPLKVVGFDLNQVRLLNGPFKHAQDLDRTYLLSLDADRLLHNFRVNASLPSKATPLGGWEEPTGELRGHFVGHYLSACSMMYAATSDLKLAAELKRRVDYLVGELAHCQDKLASGYLSAFPESFIDRVIAGKPVWAPWYTLHKILAGLEDSYTFCGNTQALSVARRMGDWIIAKTGTLSDSQIQLMLRNEQGGMNESLASLYALTENRKFLDASLHFNHLAVINPLSNRIDPLDGLHANTQIPKIIGAARQYELTGTDRLHTVADYFWNVVTSERSYVIGGNSDGEMFSPKAHLSRYFGPSTTETCNTYNMLKLTRHLFEWDPNTAYIDYYERALYNHILSSQDPDSGMMCYYVPLRAGSKRVYNSPTDSFWCCTGTGVENHARYGEMIYAHDGGANLYVNLFIASQVNWKQGGVSLRQETRFPQDASSNIKVTVDRPRALTINVRYPAWADTSFKITVNGKGIASGAPGRFVPLNRTWRTGDSIEISMPMSVHVEGFKDNPDRFAFLKGPIVLCAAIDDANSELPVLVASGSPSALVQTLTATGPLTFKTDPSLFRTTASVVTATTNPVMLTPFYANAHTRYMVYWDLFTEDQWQRKQALFKEEQARQQELERLTIDSVQPGFEQNERDHKQGGVSTAFGDFGERKWRDARDGGWFSYELRVQPDTPQSLACTYWGSDSGGREFDILVDGVLLAPQVLNNNDPQKFFTVKYALPAVAVANKSHITVRFQAHAGRMAGGLFGCRIVKSSLH